MPSIDMPLEALAVSGCNNVPHRAFSIVVATDVNSCIGKGNAVPWDSPADRKFFREITVGKPAGDKVNAVIMGRKTWDSIPAKYRPLPQRWNIVLSNQPEESFPTPTYVPGDAKVVDGKEIPDKTKVSVLRGKSLSQVLATLSTDSTFASIDRVFVAGGAQLYNESITDAACMAHLQQIIRTVVATTVDGGDTFFNIPAKTLSNDFALESAKEEAPESGPKLTFEVWNKRNEEEQQYLALCKRIINTGYKKGDRTGTGTHSLFGAQMRFSLRDGQLPLLTTKRVFWRGVCEELLWFLRGETNAQLLSDKNVHIWDANGSREFLDGRGLTKNEEGDLGPVYGFQWRHFGAEYTNCHADYDGKGVDQIRYIVDLLKHNPNDRRIVLSAWNPAAIPEMALPPCHILAQFYVSPNKELSCMLYQRSCDMGLGVPFNIASYSLLTVMLARAAGLTPGDFVHTLGDAHVYNNHVEALQEQVERTPRAFPYLRVRQDRATLEEYQCDDFEVVDYRPHPTIKMDMAV